MYIKNPFLFQGEFNKINKTFKLCISFTMLEDYIGRKKFSRLFAIRESEKSDFCTYQRIERGCLKSLFHAKIAKIDAKYAENNILIIKPFAVFALDLCSFYVNILFRLRHPRASPVLYLHLSIYPTIKIHD
jgi:hypothetical protein